MIIALVIAVGIGAMWFFAPRFATPPPIPACQGVYTFTGDQQAIRLLVKDFKATVWMVRKQGNRILLLEGMKVKTDFRSMENWVCRAQRQYGRP